MKYFIRRDLNEYGPYTLADLQRYVAQGNISPSDLTRSEGMTDWVPVSEVIGNIPAPAALPPGSPAEGTVYSGPGTVYAGPQHGGGTVYSAPSTGFGTAAAPALSPAAVPVDLHWGLVLLFGIFSCGLFYSAWLIVEAVFVKKIKPESKALLWSCVGIAGGFVSGFLGGFLKAMNGGQDSPIGPLLTLVSIIVQYVGIFTLRSDLEEYYNSVEPINLRLSGVMTFFFSVFYFQYHLSRISRWKKTGVLEAQ